jgi:hypothetical protein
MPPPPVSVGPALDEEGKAQLPERLSQMDERVKRIYDALPTNSLFIVLTSRGHLKHVSALQRQKNEYMQQRKLWTFEQEMELVRAVETARSGLAFFCFKQDLKKKKKKSTNKQIHKYPRI